MSDQDSKDYFWRGPVRTIERARSIISWTGWVFVVIGFLPLLSSLAGGRTSSRDFVGGVILAVMFAAPGGILLTRRNVLSASILVGLTGVLSILSIVLIATVGATSGSLSFIVILPVVGFWMPLTALAWRGFVATRALRRIRREGGAAVQLAATFE